jgi:DNA mismatch repair protein MutS
VNKNSINFSREEFDLKFNFSSATTMMQQYLDIKFEYQNCFLLFRMGDFFELFYDDAVEASKILGIALAKRGRNEGEDIPMCGVPHHALENYLPKLLEYGINVAICDQLETPEEAKKRGGYKAIVKRDVIRIITPATLIEDGILDSSRPNYLSSLIIENDNVVFAYTDISTGEFEVSEFDIKDLFSEIHKINPKEIIISDKILSVNQAKLVLKNFERSLVFQPEIVFDTSRAERSILNFFSIVSLDSFGRLKQRQISAVGAILQYLKATQKNNIPKLNYPSFVSNLDHMILDYPTRKSLELTETLSGKRQGSLISAIDRTKTPAGARLLYSFISSPLKNLNQILSRQKITSFFYEDQNLREQVRETISNIADLDRLLSKITARRCSPFDILFLKNSLIFVLEIKKILLADYGTQNIPEIVLDLLKNLKFDTALLDELDNAIKDEPSTNLLDGDFIKETYHPKLAELSMLINNSKAIIEELKLKYQKLTGIDNLKISHNNIIGLYVEVTSKNISKINLQFFQYRQSTSNTTRYSTDELADIQSKIVNANTLKIALENEIFQRICDLVDESRESIRLVAKTIASVDVFSSFAEAAVLNKFVCPEFCEKSSFIIKGGRHPVVEDYLDKEGKYFTKNDLIFNDDNKVIILTGPNMGGKSTYLRQVAIITILAQIGSYVPADEAKLSLVDRVFSRVGSSDELSSGRSTFMVEMQECAAILNNATKNSLVILDEVGRGTSTYDGISVAWAIVEHLSEKIKCNSLFATHYHELTQLSGYLMNVKNYNLVVEEVGSEMIFTHKVKSGFADKSYGIHVAELAGIPKTVINKSKTILKSFEKENAKKVNLVSEIHNQDLLSTLQKNQDNRNNILNDIVHLNLNEISPIEALNFLSKIQKNAKENP